MYDMKICTRCGIEKDLYTCYYMCSGKWKSECKMCTIKIVSRDQKKKGSWRYREIDLDSRRDYMRLYRELNKEKFIEYRKRFNARHPDYYKEYHRRQKEKQ